MPPKTKRVRVVMSVTPKEIIELSQMVYARHTELGAQSPLTPLNWATLGPQVSEAMKLHLEAEDLKRKWEQKYRERDFLVEQLDELNKQSRDLLKALYMKEPKKLGEFGFTVDDSPKPKKE